MYSCSLTCGYNIKVCVNNMILSLSLSLSLPKFQSVVNFNFSKISINKCMKNVWEMFETSSCIILSLKIPQLYFKTPQKNKNKMKFVIWEKKFVICPKNTTMT